MQHWLCYKKMTKCLRKDIAVGKRESSYGLYRGNKNLFSIMNTVKRENNSSILYILLPHLVSSLPRTFYSFYSSLIYSFAYHHPIFVRLISTLYSRNSSNHHPTYVQCVKYCAKSKSTTENGTSGLSEVKWIKRINK